MGAVEGGGTRQAISADIQSAQPLESFTWFRALHNYCHPPRIGEDEEMDDEAGLGPEGDLIPDMVNKTIAPLLTKAFEAGAYDPYSAPQTRQAVDLVDVVRELSGKDSRKHADLLKAVLNIFHEHLLDLASQVSACMSGDAVPPPAAHPDSSAALRRFVHRRVKLLKNMLLWSREAPTEIREFINRLASEILRPILERNWEGEGGTLGQLVGVPLQWCSMAESQFARTAGTELRPDLAVFFHEGPRRVW